MNKEGGDDMNVKVMYNSRTGNTRKLGEAIAKAVGTPAVQIMDSNNFDCADILFIGDGIYASKCDKKTENFIKTLDSSKVKNAAVFGTYGGQKKAITLMRELLIKQGINVIGEGFGCKGKSWFFFNRKHPDNNDLRDAEEFAKSIVKSKYIK